MQHTPRFSIVVIGVLCMTSALTFFMRRWPSPALAQRSGNAGQLDEAARLRASAAKLYREGKHEEAVRDAMRAVEILEKVAPNDFKTADALNDLGELYLIQNKHDQAEKTFLRALQICELNPAQNSLPISHILERLGKIAFRKSDDIKADDLLQHSLQMRRAALKGNPVNLADSLIDLANLYYDERRFPKGDGIYVEGLSLLEDNLGRSNPKVIEAMKGYACAVLRAGEGSAKGALPIEPDKDTKALRRRAQCWLYGFDDNCADASRQSSEYAGLINGRAIRLATPIFAKGLAQILGGRVFVAVRINENGKVVKATAVCGALPDLTKAALEAARESRFTPTVLDAKPIQVSGIVVYTFVPGKR